jgi:hypothetical protein
MTTPDMRELVLPRQYIEDRQLIFKSLESWRWFERDNRQTLIERGALVAPAGRKMIHPALADAVVHEVGLAKARAMTKRSNAHGGPAD